MPNPPNPLVSVPLHFLRIIHHSLSFSLNTFAHPFLPAYFDETLRQRAAHELHQPLLTLSLSPVFLTLSNHLSLSLMLSFSISISLSLPTKTTHQLTPSLFISFISSLSFSLSLQANPRSPSSPPSSSYLSSSSSSPPPQPASTPPQPPPPQPSNTTILPRSKTSPPKPPSTTILHHQQLLLQTNTVDALRTNHRSPSHLLTPSAPSRLSSEPASISSALPEPLHRPILSSSPPSQRLLTAYTTPSHVESLRRHPDNPRQPPPTSGKP